MRFTIFGHKNPHFISVDRIILRVKNFGTNRQNSDGIERDISLLFQLSSSRTDLVRLLPKSNCLTHPHVSTKTISLEIIRKHRDFSLEFFQSASNESRDFHVQITLATLHFGLFEFFSAEDRQSLGKGKIKEKLQLEATCDCSHGDRLNVFMLCVSPSFFIDNPCATTSNVIIRDWGANRWKRMGERVDKCRDIWFCYLFSRTEVLAKRSDRMVLSIPDLVSTTDGGKSNDGREQGGFRERQVLDRQSATTRLWELLERIRCHG